jgi:hypothetical protein
VGAQQVVNGSAGTVKLEKALEAPLMLQDKDRRVINNPPAGMEGRRIIMLF